MEDQTREGPQAREAWKEVGHRRGGAAAKRMLIALLLLGLTLSACTAGPNALADTPDEEGQVAGFWQGLWHGVISPITFVISLFNDNVSVFDVHNNGGWYVFGFLLGASIVFGGGGRRSRRWRN